MTDPLERARDARDRHASRLMERPGVVSVGLGLDSDGRPAIVVGVAGVRAADAEVPETIDGVPVLLKDVGRPRAETEDESGDGERV